MLFCLEMDYSSLNNSDSALTFVVLIYMQHQNGTLGLVHARQVPLSYIPSPWYSEPRFPFVVQAAHGFVTLLLQFPVC